MKDANITVRIIQRNKEITLIFQKGVSLTEVFRKAEIDYSYPCGGNARCGKCRAKFIDGAPDATSFDTSFISEKELEDGVRLACRCRLDKDSAIEVLSSDDEMDIVSAKGQGAKEGTDYAIAIDLGTTTIAAALIGGAGELTILDTATCVNRQRKFGADVISRISAAEDIAAATAMRDMVVEDIESLVKELLPQGPDNLKTIVVAGNTTMLHLLQKMDVSGLGRYPYTPESIEMINTDAGDVFPALKGKSLTILPGFSAFVGADIVSGLYGLENDPDEKFFFLDLGTNGEMAYYDGEKLRVTSTAAGPVFEAGGINCGMASVPGAICGATIEASEDHAHIRTDIKTIRDKDPIGICGTGVLELVSELSRVGIIDETGLLSDEFFDEGFPVTEDGRIRLTQQDIRNVQLAKAAIFTGAKALLQGEAPKTLYIAGGFGSSIDVEKIAYLRMFPEKFSGNMKAVGNLSLKGAAKYAFEILKGKDAERDAKSEILAIIEKAELIELSGQDSFDEEYIAAMNF